MFFKSSREYDSENAAVFAVNFHVDLSQLVFLLNVVDKFRFYHNIDIRYNIILYKRAQNGVRAHARNSGTPPPLGHPLSGKIHFRGGKQGGVNNISHAFKTHRVGGLYNADCLCLLDC